jgi:hypothetical protein
MLGKLEQALDAQPSHGGSGKVGESRPEHRNCEKGEGTGVGKGGEALSENAEHRRPRGEGQPHLQAGKQREGSPVEQVHRGSENQHPKGAPQDDPRGLRCGNRG